MRPAQCAESSASRFLAEQVPFYAMALMVFWPGMLIAPALDRSPLRGIARGVAVVYFVFFSFYYWHDTGSNLIETLITGLRLMQVALPVWIVSYAIVVDDRLAAPLCRRFGPRVVALACLAIVIVLFAANAVGFIKHSKYLRTLEAGRDALAAEAPSGSVVIQHGAVSKLFAIPEGRPVYRWWNIGPGGSPYNPRLDAVLDGLRSPWFLAILARGDASLSDYETGSDRSLSDAPGQDGRPGPDSLPGRPHAMKPPRVAIIADYPEEVWPSMDLVAEMILTHLRRDHAGEIDAVRICPPYRHRLGRLPRLGRNADRVLNRYHDYPRYLSKLIHRESFDVYHIIDHSYAQLVHVLPADRTVVTCHDLDAFRCLLRPELEPRPRLVPCPGAAHPSRAPGGGGDRMR